MDKSALLHEYNRSLHPSRVAFARSEGLQTFVGMTEPRRLHAFMLFWTAYSVSMTKQVENWIRSAGESCGQKGWRNIEQHLKRHAQHEKDHDQMLVEDLDVLVGLWNKNYQGNVSAQELLSMKIPPGTEEYIRLHEDVIKGQTPFCQIAIEFEIERLSVFSGPQMIENVVNTLGRDFEKGLSFLTHHVVLDQGHTQFNSKLIENCLGDDSTRLQPLIETGKKALAIYGQFLSDCAERSAVLA